MYRFSFFVILKEYNFKRNKYLEYISKYSLSLMVIYIVSHVEIIKKYVMLIK